MFKKIIQILKNKYVLITLAFIIWLLFFDKNNMISQKKLRKNLKQLKHDKEYYKKEIQKDSISTQELLTDTSNLKKFAREKYLMKKDSEDIFLIIREK
jgi:uncharacterized membrane-anchored protein YhcB (DUF1043 family)